MDDFSALLAGFQVALSWHNVGFMAVGVILDGPQAEAILKAGQADLIAIGREALTDPHWGLHAAQAVEGAGRCSRGCGRLGDGAQG